MRIYIIGPSGSGKTHLAQKLSQKYHISPTNLDQIFNDFGSGAQVPEEEWRSALSILMAKPDWIIEGVNPIPDAFEAANKVIYLRPPLIKALLNQWKRYCTDPKQRREHGLVNNFKLSHYILKQYVEKPDPSKTNDPKYSRVKKIDALVLPYKYKVEFLVTSIGI